MISDDLITYDLIAKRERGEREMTGTRDPWGSLLYRSIMAQGLNGWCSRHGYGVVVVVVEI
jgi:hypothetical protein